MPTILITALFAIGCGFTTSLMLHYGVGLSSDSLSYFRFPESGSWDALPVHHGILYAMVLRLAVYSTGWPLMQAAAWVNIICATATAAITFWFFTQNRPYRPVFGAITAFLICFSLPFLSCHTSAMSEPLFTLLFSAGLYTLIHYCKKGTLQSGICSALLMAAACLTRYAGLAFVGAACLSILFFSKRKHTQRWISALSYGALATLPLAGILLANKHYAGTSTNRDMVFHWIPSDSVMEWLGTLASWFAPERIFIQFPVSGVVCAIALVALVVAAWRHATAKSAPEAGILTLFAAGYSAFILLSITLFDVSIMLSQRMLEPLIFCLFPLLTIFAAHRQATSIMRWAGILFFAYWVCFTTYRAVNFVNKTYHNGTGFSSRAWTESPFIQLIETLQSDYIIYSNAGDALHLRGFSRIRFIPPRQKSTSLQAVPSFHKAYDALKNDLQENGAFLAYIHLRYWPPYRVSLEEIVTDNGLLAVITTKDGTLYSTTDNPNLPAIRERVEAGGGL